MDLIEALDIAEARCVAVVGAGGKTALCWQMTQALLRRQRRALFSTTTRIWEPSDRAFDLKLVQLPSSSLSHLIQALRSHPWHSACLIGEALIDPTIEPAAPTEPDSWMPVLARKRAGLSGEMICAIRQALPDATLIIEADGARGLPLKAPNDTEPVIPTCADRVCVLACLDAIGQPLDAHTVHRPDRFADLTGLDLGQTISPEAIVAALSHTQGGRKSIPAHAQAIAVLTQRAPEHLHPAAPAMLATLVQRGFQRAVALAPRAEQPVLALQS